VDSRLILQGQALRQRIIGEGPPVLLVHGWGAHIDLLQPVATRLASRGYRCYMFDLPGFGSSAEPTTPFTVADYAALCRAYLDYHGLQSAYYFGHSLGGRIGLLLAADYGPRLRALALSNSAGLKERPPLSQRLRLKLYQGLRAGLEGSGAQAAAARLRQLYNRRYGSADYQNASPIMRQTLINIVNQDLLAQARRVTCPTILIWGDKDGDTPLWMGQKLAEAIADAALIVHKGAGHYAYLDFPEKTASIVAALYSAS